MLFLDSTSIFEVFSVYSSSSESTSSKNSFVSSSKFSSLTSWRVWASVTKSPIEFIFFNWANELISFELFSSIFSSCEAVFLNVSPNVGVVFGEKSPTGNPKPTADASVISEDVWTPANFESIVSINALILKSWDCFKSILPKFK